MGYPKGILGHVDGGCMSYKLRASSGSITLEPGRHELWIGVAVAVLGLIVIPIGIGLRLSGNLIFALSLSGIWTGGIFIAVHVMYRRHLVRVDFDLHNRIMRVTGSRRLRFPGLVSPSTPLDTSLSFDDLVALQVCQSRLRRHRSQLNVVTNDSTYDPRVYLCSGKLAHLRRLARRIISEIPLVCIDGDGQKINF